MKSRPVCMLLFLCLLVSLPAAALAADDCSSAALKAQVEKGAALLAQKGAAGLEEVKAMRFCNGQGYLYVVDEHGVVLVHPVAPHLVGKNQSTLKDANGKLFALELLDTCRLKGEAWIHYMWPKPGEKAPSDKCGYGKRTTLDGKPVTVASGLHDIAPGQCGQ